MAPRSRDVNKADEGEENVHVNDVLCFLRARRNVIPTDDLVAIAKNTYGSEAAKEALQLYVSVKPQASAPAPSSGEKLASRRGATTEPETALKIILRLMGEDDPRIPLFAAVEIDKIPPVDLRNIDGAHIIAQNRDVRAEISSHGLVIEKIQQALDEVLSLVKAPCSCDSNAERMSKMEMCIAKLLAEKKSTSVPNSIHTPTSKNDLMTTEGTPSGRTSGSAARAVLRSRTQRPTGQPPPPPPSPASLPPPPHPPPNSEPPSPSPTPLPPPHPPTPPRAHSSLPACSQLEVCTHSEAQYSDMVRRETSAQTRRSITNDDDQPLPSNQQGFTDVSAIRKKKASRKNPNVKIGTGRTLQESFATIGTAKLFVSLPYPGSRYPLKRMKERVKQHLGEEALFKCKKRLSTKGNTTPFEIYGDANLLESVLFDENIWEERTCLQLVKTNVRLPKDYNQTDEESEEDVRVRVREIQVNRRRRIRDPVQDLAAI